MNIPTRTIVLGLVLGLTATAVRAQTKAAETAPPINAATTPRSTPMDLTLRPAAALPSTAVDLALRPAAALPSTAVPLPPQSTSEEVKRVLRWIVDSRDNAGLPYLLVDKDNAQVLAFNAAGQLQGMTPALLGMARGDRMLAPNDAPMLAMPPQVRITPAGRFVSRLMLDSDGKEVLVLDYDASLSLHAVIEGTPKERRAERLKSATPEDNRISFGCINVPVEFYSKIVSPAFTGTKGIVYVLPETSPASAMFGLQPAGAALAGAPQGAASQEARAVQPAPASAPPASQASAPVAR